MAGIFVQTIAFAGVYTGVLLANDLKNGMIDRFRSLPMLQSSVLTGRTLTDLLRAMLAVAVMTVVGLLVGFRPEGRRGRMVPGHRRDADLRLRPLVGRRGDGFRSSARPKRCRG